MLSGTVSKLSEEVIPSAATISPKSDTVRITGSAAIVNINPPFGGNSGILFLVPVDSSTFTWTDAGNIAIAGSAEEGRVLVMIYSKSTGKWYPNYTGS